VADEWGLEHQVCKAHVQRNTEALIESLKPAAEQDTDSSLEAMVMTTSSSRSWLDTVWLWR
jgi:hypothetical protein